MTISFRGQRCKEQLDFWLSIEALDGLQDLDRSGLELNESFDL